MSKRITSISLCFLLVFTILITDYKKVSAFEWAIPTITFDAAMPFLMGLLGVAYANDEAKSLTTEDEFFSYCEEENIPGPDVSAWISDVCSGTLNQASSVWSAFKSWVNSLKSQSTSANIEVTNLINTVYPSASISIPSSFTSAKYGYYVYIGTKVKCFLFDETYSYSFDSSNGTLTFTRANNQSQYITTSLSYPTDTTSSLNFVSSSNTVHTSGYETYVFGIPVSVFDGFSNFHSWEEPITTTDLFNYLSGINQNLLDLINSGATSVSIPDVISLPWQNVGDTTQDISQTIEGLIDAVNEGTLELSDLVTTIQGLLGVITVDTTNDIVIPETINPDTEEPVTPEEVVNENISNSSFILSGLEKVFPFCLPFDLYNFVTLLVADPVAPIINFPIYDPTTKESIDIVIDFSQWESVVILFRYIFDFLFIIGMILVSRSLIGGGDKS